jgi:hypothetical protein
MEIRWEWPLLDDKNDKVKSKEGESDNGDISGAVSPPPSTTISLFPTFSFDTTVLSTEADIGKNKDGNNA